MRAARHRRSSASRVGLTTGRFEPIWIHAPSVKRTGIERRPPRARVSAPSPAQAAVLAQLSDTPRLPGSIAEALGRPRQGVAASLAGLRSKGFAAHVRGGWVRV